MGPARLAGVCAVIGLAFTGCTSTASRDTQPPLAEASASHVPESTPEERPDTTHAATQDSTTMLLAMLPAPSGTPLSGEAAAMADRAVFPPLTQRWFMARMVDSALAVDVGRIDGGIGNTDAARAAFAAMVGARSPVQPGMRVTVHSHAGSANARVASLRVSGRRIVALLDAPALDSAERAVPVEWRGDPPVPARVAKAVPCSVGDTAAIAATIARVSAPLPPPAPREAISVMRGCFGDFRAIVAGRPLDITPETVERLTLVRANGSTKKSTLRDLAYPLHELLSVIDIDGDGTNEIVVHSYRMSMETWAALRMTDSVTFTRFSGGFTIEKR
jgi:hypothetical protein